MSAQETAAASDTSAAVESKPASTNGTTVEAGASNSGGEKNDGLWLTQAQLAIAAVIIVALLILVGVVVGLAVAGACGSGGRRASAAYDDDAERNDISSLALTESASDEKMTEKEYADDIRLPSNLVPMHYQLEVRPVLEPDFSFSGQVAIDMRVAEPTDRIVLHVKKLSVDEHSILLSRVDDAVPDSSAIAPAGENSVDQEVLLANRSLLPASIAYDRLEMDEEREFMVLHLPEALVADAIYRLAIRFSGNLTDRMSGLYRSSYKRSDGSTAWLVASQLQPTDARTVFPCFDEPALKATFQVTIVRPAQLISLSNMALESRQQRGDNLVADVCKTSVPMSTYLLAFVMADFEYREARSANGVHLRVWARRDAIEQADYALSITGRMLTYYETYFKIPFPLSKIDQVAVPDFQAGAMENWGLILYRETALLFDEKVSSILWKQRVATVIAHELSHQWFGNLATPKWWDDIWLNEGFATYVSYPGVDHVHKDWRMFEEFVEEEVQRTFQPDGLSNSHPISAPIAHPDEINEIFDSISYGKGASIIRMMRHFLGEDAFRDGVSTYLHHFRYASAEQNDLWSFLSDAAIRAGLDVDVKAVMDTWTLQMGYPVVTLRRDYEGNSLSLEQSRFLLVEPSSGAEVDVDKRYPSPFNYTWHVPITVAGRADVNFGKIERSGHHSTIWMQRENVTITDGLPRPDAWILANVLQTGYYRVNYDDQNWRRLIQQLKRGRAEIHPINRAQLLDDALNMARSGRLDYDIALGVTEYLIGEQEYLPWSSALRNIAYVDTMMRSSEHYGLLKTYMLRQLNSIFSLLGWSEDPDDTFVRLKLRAKVIQAACYYGLEDCISSARRQYKAWMVNPESNPIRPNLKSSVYCTAIKHGDAEQWDFAWNMYLKANVANERRQLLRALACSREPWILNRLLERSLNESLIKRQDGDTSIGYVSGSAIGRFLAWSFFRDRYDVIYERYGSAFFGFSSLIKRLVKGINGKSDLHEVERLFAERRQSEQLGTGKRAFEQSIETVSGNLNWIEKNQKTIVGWLSRKTA